MALKLGWRLVNRTSSPVMNLTDMLGDLEVSFCSVIRGLHVYQAIWMPTIGEELSTDREHGNPADQVQFDPISPRSLL